MNNLGWVSLHRKFLTWKFFNDSDAVKLFIYLLLSASPKDEIQGNFALKSGQIITSFRKLTKDCNISFKKIRILLEKFQQEQIIDIHTCTQFSLVTILNYNSYQKKQQKNFLKNEIEKGTEKGTKKGTEKGTLKTNTILGLEDFNGTEKGTEIDTEKGTENFNKGTEKDTKKGTEIGTLKTNTTLGLEDFKGTEKGTEIDTEKGTGQINNNKLNNKKCVCVNTAAEFENELKKYESKYTEEFRRSFFLWWTQRDETGKMRFQSMGLFDLEKRLELWKISEQKIKTGGGRRGRQQQPTEATLNPETVAFMTGK